MEPTQRGVARLAGLGLLLLGGGLYLASRPPHRSTASLQPDVGGELELVVGYVASARQSALRNAHLVTEVVNGLPDDVEVLLATNDRDAFTVRNPWPGRVRFVELSPEKTFTIWPQDPFLVLEEADGSRTLLLSREFERADDVWFGRELGAAIDWPTRTSELAFEGGNLVSDEKAVFIGANTIRDNAHRLEEDDPSIVRRFERELGRPVLVIGPLPQPVGHIDMMLTPLGNGRVVVADAREGAFIARRALRDAPADVTAFEERTEASFFGHPSVRALVNETGETIESPPIVGETANAAAASEAIADALDGVATALSERGYVVSRVPLLIGEPRQEGVEGPGFPTLTYNNVLLETQTQTQTGTGTGTGTGTANVTEWETVFLPRYGLRVLDEAARKTWTGLGFRVRSIEGLTVSAMYGGSLRCCIKVLSRRSRGTHVPE